MKKKVTLTKDQTIDEKEYQAGAVVELNEATATHLIKHGLATECKPAKEEKAPAPKA